jgi:hypothetical protein
MEVIGQTEMWSFFDDRRISVITTNTTVRRGPGHFVRSYLELATKVAELQFRNREQVLMFRGQAADYKNQKKHTTLKPSLFRPGADGKNPDVGLLTRRFTKLQQAERELRLLYKGKELLGVERLKRQRVLRWAILQHYEVCPTPLLDVTHSLRIGASFGSYAGANTPANEAFVFVLGVPNLSGAITASAEAGLQIVRLSSVCPPVAVRPHIQEGYLLGEYPEMADFGQKELYQHYEIDFGRRLVAKFRFKPQQFWKGDDFPKVTESALYPPEREDRLFRLAVKVKKKIGG